MNALEKVRAEVERRKGLLKPKPGQGVILCQEIVKQFDSLISFIDSIVQPVMKDDTIDMIRSEVERRFTEYNQDSNHHIQAAECASILDFIDSITDEPVAEGLEEEIKRYLREDCSKDDEPTTSDIARHFAEWQADQFEKNRLAHCDGLTKEQYDRETDFALEIINKEHRHPTFSDAIEYGMRVQKEQMMKGAVEGEVMLNGRYPYEPRVVVPYPNCPYEYGDSVKVLILHSDE